MLYSYSPASTQQGGYASYLQGKQERLERQDAIYQSTKNKYKNELDWMKRQPQARESKSKARIDAFYKLQDAMNSQQRSDSSLVLRNTGRRIGNQILQVSF